MDNINKTDLFMESARIDSIRAERGSDRDVFSELDRGGVKVCRFFVKDDKDAHRYNCPKGRYSTLFFEKLPVLSESYTEKIISALAEEIILMLQSCLEGDSGNASVLVAGLGNRSMAADSIGPLTSEAVTVTRKIGAGTSLRSVSSVCCGVVGDTGIEACEMLSGILKQTGAKIVIAVDSLCARDVARLSSVIQLTDTGIVPGAGIGNRRDALNRDTLGVPVIAIGMPTVVSAATLVNGAVDSKRCCIDASAIQGYSDLFVCPKDCDLISREASQLIARALDRSLIGI